ncbi:histidine phosphatase family protein [Cryobacterium adonitolivorans]|uniref:Histidine phosphatase family protein n=1 Tax=Cryobacterium adonitolivorans TaxID=1259189 RepID=A0A4R8W469_9MICO|nr:histidine phosphatase family protein [Cryobacterium adonitolivorans]TFC00661.1 histidine phosphatase family protein [Cryobacterium adonitolivorans]
MTATTTFALVRHGQTDWNAAGRIQGATDVPLNDVGRGQATEAVGPLSQYEWDFIVASPLSRAAETADIIAVDLDLEVTRHLPGLVERNYGPAEGLSAGPELDELRVDGSYGSFRGAEAEDSVSGRGLGALRQLAEDYPGARIIVVCHGTLIRLSLMAALEREIPPIQNAAMSVVQFGPEAGWTASVINNEILEADALV